MRPTSLFSEAVLVQALKEPEDLLANNTLYPASGSFIDVGDFDRFAFLIHCGALANEQTFQVQQAQTINGTPKNLTGAVKVVATAGADKWYLIEVAVEHLDTNGGYTFVTLKNSGGSTGDYADILFLGLIPGIQPVQHGDDMGDIVKIVG